MIGGATLFYSAINSTNNFPAAAGWVTLTIHQTLSAIQEVLLKYILTGFLPVPWQLHLREVHSNGYMILQLLLRRWEPVLQLQLQLQLLVIPLKREGIRHN
jgi:hypothetical protein